MMCELVTYIIARARNKNKGTSAPNELAPFFFSSCCLLTIQYIQYSMCFMILLWWPTPLSLRFAWQMTPFSQHKRQLYKLLFRKHYKLVSTHIVREIDLYYLCHYLS